MKEWTFEADSQLMKHYGPQAVLSHPKEHGIPRQWNGPHCKLNPQRYSYMMMSMCEGYSSRPPIAPAFANAQEWAYISNCAMQAVEGSRGSAIWQNLKKNGLEDNTQTLAWRIQKQFEEGMDDGTLSGSGIRSASTTMRALIPMANFTDGKKADIANGYISHVQTFGLQKPKSNSGIEAFTTMPAALLHNPDEIADTAWESREAARAASHA